MQIKGSKYTIIWTHQKPLKVNMVAKGFFFSKKREWLWGNFFAGNHAWDHPNTLSHCHSFWLWDLVNGHQEFHYKFWLWD
jgi:hypothetical protein